MKKDLLITGLPRSGTSLLTSIIAANSDSIVFSEPSWLKRVRQQSSNCNEFSNQLQVKIKQLRTDIQSGQALSLKLSNKDKGVPTNYYIRDDQGKIKTDKNEQLCVFPKRFYNQQFVIKANAQFTSCLESLVKSKKYKIICVIRNPIAAIMSWRSLNIPVSKGNMRIAEKYSSDYTQFTLKADELLNKQALIADWFFKQYTHFAQDITLVKYEDLVNDSKSVLSNILNKEDFVLPQLSIQNKSKHYNLDESNDIKSALISHGQYYKNYYPDLL